MEKPWMVLQNSIQAVLTDEGFQVPSSQAQVSVQVATEILTWCASAANQEILHKFSTWLADFLKPCFKQSESLRLRKEMMWGKFHQLRTTEMFKREWETFLEICGQVVLPAFYQFVSNVFFNELVRQYHCISQRLESESHISPMTNEEEKALRYVAGHICRKVQLRISSSSIPNREDMVLFIVDLSGDELDEDRGTEDWLNAIDRGGLWHVNDDTYTIFYIIEEASRKHFQVTAAKHLKEGDKNRLIDNIMKNEDLLFQWSILSNRIDDSVGMTVLKMLVELYVTIRGFAFTTSCLELFKQRFKKKLQKSKSLRHELLPKECSSSS